MSRHIKIIFILALLAGFCFRLFLIPVAKHGDINNNTSWGRLLQERGPVNFYEGKSWPYSEPNQPPLYLYLFVTTRVIETSLSNVIQSVNERVAAFPSGIVWWWETWGELTMAKMPGILADLIIASVIFFYFRKKKNTALILSSLWLINPVSWYNSAIWGGTDGIVNLLGLLSIVMLLKKRLRLSLLLLCMSVLFKGSLTLFIPLLLLIAWIQNYTLDEWVKAVTLSFFFTVFVALPFHPQADVVVWLTRLYTERFFPGEIGSLTANAFNFWWLVDSGRTLDSILYFGIPARLWGIVVTAFFYVFLCIKIWRRPKDSSILLSFALVGLFTFIFMTRIHERYLYPFFPFATLTLASYRFLWIPYAVLSITHVLNLYHMFWAPEFLQMRHWFVGPFMSILALVNIFIFLSIIWRTRKSL